MSKRIREIKAKVEAATATEAELDELMQLEQNAQMARAMKEQELKRRGMEDGDMPLDLFDEPGEDADDEDCLFVHRWMRRGTCGFIVSTSGVGKSTFTMQAATLWAGGMPMLGITPMKPLKVGIIQNEDDGYDVATFRDRIRIGLRDEAKWTPEQIAEAESRVTFCSWNGSTGKEFVEYLRKKQEVHHFDLVIVNPLFAFFGGDINKANEVSAFFRNGIDRVIKDAATKCGILFVHHTGKPSREKLAEGDFFAAYLGSGSTELTNYTRVALTLLPYDGGKIRGAFVLIGSKHGDQIGWRDEDGKLTTKKVICYANRLERHKADGCIYWCEPTAEELAALKPGATQGSTKKADPWEGKLTELVNVCNRNFAPFASKNALAKALVEKCKIAENTAAARIAKALECGKIVERQGDGASKRIGTPDQFEEAESEEPYWNK